MNLRHITVAGSVPVLLLLAGRLLLGDPGSAAPGSGLTPDDPKQADRLDRPVGDLPGDDAEGIQEPVERVILADGRDLFLEVRVGKEDTLPVLGRRYLEDGRLAPAMQGLEAGALPGPGRSVRIPYELLHPDYRLRVLRDLFPVDEPGEGGWVHQVGAGRLTVSEESLWNLALWYTGRGDHFAIIADRNRLPDLSPQPGQSLIIPGEILIAPFAELAGMPRPDHILNDDFSLAAGREAPVPDPETADSMEPSPQTGTGQEQSAPSRPVAAAEGAEDLSYGSDRSGPHAVYKLKRGEALYSAVVVRFTGRVDAQDVNDLARRIARRNSIKDVTGIPVGFPIKISFDHLLPEYLPSDDPRRIAWERGEAGVARYTNRARSRDLEGVAVILDAGHGGKDRGTAHNGVWEHDYVYDILCRIKALLEEKTRARVLTTIRDRKEGYTIHDRTKLRRNQAEILLTDPPFRLRRGTISVNLRWYLSNYYYRQLVKEGVDPLKVVFTSLHADARHPSLTGAMIYVPGEEYRRGRYGNGSSVYARYREVRQAPYVKFPRKAREQSEGLSRQFASELVKSFRKIGVPVYAHRPVRERIIRRGRSWVPAVLRCNIVPVEVLLEVCNLSNRSDGKRLAKPSFRQKVAEAYVESLKSYFDGPEEPVTTAAQRSR